MSFRIAYARFAQETNALSPVRTTVEDFRRTHFVDGEALLKAVSKKSHEVPGYVRNAELSGFMRACDEAAVAIETVPLFSAWAVPNGPLSVECFTYFRDRLLRELAEAGPLDGVFLSLHGAMNADDHPDCEGELLTAVRALLGPDVPVAITLDLHGNLNRAVVESVDILAGYQTNPHRDHAKVAHKATTALIARLAGRARPVSAWRSLPLVLGGGTTIDFLPTMRPIFKRMKAMEREPGVLCASLFMCHPWNDTRALGWSTHVVTDGDPALAERYAEELADMAWALRLKQPPTFKNASQAIDVVRKSKLARRLGTVTLSDVSDVVSAGAPGENPRLLEALLNDATDLLSYAAIRDTDVVAELWDRAEGSTVTVALSGKLHPELNAPLTVTGRVGRKLPTQPFGRIVVLDCGHVKLAITEDQPFVVKPSFYKDLGLDPLRADAVMVKNFFPFLLFFLPYHRRTVFVQTKGVTDFDAARDIAQDDPVYPFAPVAAWRPTDRKRRGLTAGAEAAQA